MAKVIDTGWVKLHRKIKEKGWYRDSEYVHLWVHLLLKANHSGAEYLNNGVIVKLKAGQMITGRKQLSIETGVSESKIERVLKCFEKDGEIEQHTNSRNRLISIVSWETTQKSEQQTDSKRTADGQQVDTNNNDNTLKNEEEIVYAHWIEQFIKTELHQVGKMKIQMNLKEMQEIDKKYISEKIKDKLDEMDNKTDLLKKYSKVSSTLRNWLKREGESALKSDKELTNAERQALAGYSDKLFG